jgi:hypothetical protein
MLSAIELDDELIFKEYEINNVIPNGMLPSYFFSAQTPASEVQPNNLLCFRRQFSEFSGMQIHLVGHILPSLPL